jgi:PTS system cellobiose-specific IIB component
MDFQSSKKSEFGRRNPMNPTIHLMIVCSLGATSSVLCQKIQDAARKRGISLIAESTGIGEWTVKLSEVNAVLLEPQIRHLKKELEQIAKKHQKPLALVDPIAFATMNGEKVLDQVLKLLQTKKAL